MKTYDYTGKSFEERSKALENMMQVHMNLLSRGYDSYVFATGETMRKVLIQDMEKRLQKHGIPYMKDSKKITNGTACIYFAIAQLSGAAAVHTVMVTVTMAAHVVPEVLKEIAMIPSTAGTGAWESRLVLI